MLSLGLAPFTACGSADVPEKLPKEAECPAATPAALSPVRPPGVLDTLRTLLRQRNAAIDEVALQDIRKIKYSRNFVAVGWGVRGDHTFHGSWEDELFIVMMLDSSLTRIVRVFEVLPSPRWLDFTISIESMAGDSLVVAGEGATYGDGPIRRAYALTDSI